MSFPPRLGKTTKLTSVMSYRRSPMLPFRLRGSSTAISQVALARPARMSALIPRKTRMATRPKCADAAIHDETVDPRIQCVVSVRATRSMIIQTRLPCLQCLLVRQRMHLIALSLFMLAGTAMPR
eukprot:UN1691